MEKGLYAPLSPRTAQLLNPTAIYITTAARDVSWITKSGLGLVPVRVDIDVVLPLVRSQVGREDRLDGTGRLARAAVDADLGIDVEHLVRGEVRLVLPR